MRRAKQRMQWAAVLLPALALLVCLLPLGARAQQPPEQKIYDHASIFSEAERAALEELAGQLVRETQVDLVVVTTADTQGKTTADFAHDYFDDNGFGIGVSCDGMLLLFDMQNREVYISTHALALDYFTDADIESLLDAIFDNMADANYSAGAEAFLRNAAGHIMEKRAEAEAGPPLPVFGEVDPREKVYDFTGTLTTAQMEELAGMARETFRKHNFDLAVALVPHTGGQSMLSFADDFYDYNGFGAGQGADGMLLIIRLDDDGGWGLQVSAHGTGSDWYTDGQMDALLDKVAARMDAGDAAGAARLFLEETGKTAARGGKPAFGTRLWAAFKKALPAGVVVAGIITAIMALVHSRSSKPQKVSALQHYNTGGIREVENDDAFVTTRIDKRPIPKDTSSSSSGRSYSGGSGGTRHTSSSGRTHSGGSRSSGTLSSRSSSGRTHGGGGRKF